MDVIAAADAKTNFGALLDKAQREPVKISKNSRDVAVVMSMEATFNRSSSPPISRSTFRATGK